MASEAKQSQGLKIATQNPHKLNVIVRYASQSQSIKIAKQNPHKLNVIVRYASQSQSIKIAKQNPHKLNVIANEVKQSQGLNPKQVMSVPIRRRRSTDDTPPRKSGL
ncbi:hypothetical protein QUA56_20015 [Microcoleus sp. N3A4]|uniref:hypothetical protein n=1 Tax=Microcoleus sp. N3A4 TaxID=3055379 RepID=UPI002FD2F10B